LRKLTNGAEVIGEMRNAGRSVGQPCFVPRWWMLHHLEPRLSFVGEGSTQRAPLIVVHGLTFPGGRPIGIAELFATSGAIEELQPVTEVFDVGSDGSPSARSCARSLGRKSIE